MKTIFKTNLDKCQEDVASLNSNYRSELTNTDKHNITFAVGNRITFWFDRWCHESQKSQRFCYDLEVVGVSYSFTTDRHDPSFKPYVSVELHIPTNRRYMSMDEYYKWFNKHRWGK